MWYFGLVSKSVLVWTIFFSSSTSHSILAPAVPCRLPVRLLTSSCACQYYHLGPEHASREKILSIEILLFSCTKMYTKLDIKRSKSAFERVLRKSSFSHFSPWENDFPVRGQKWFLRPYFPLIRGMFVFRSGLRFSFQTLEVPETKVRKRPY